MRVIACCAFLLFTAALGFGQHCPRAGAGCMTPPPAAPPLPHYESPLPPQLPPDSQPDRDIFEFAEPAQPLVEPPRPSPPTPPTPADGGIGHLLKAAEHLEAAGMTKQAARLREQAQRRRLLPTLAKKEAQLQSLQAEVANLRRRAGRSGQVVIEIKVFEVSLDKLRSLGYDVPAAGLAGWLDPAGGEPATSSGVTTCLAGRAETVARLMEALRRNGLVKEVASPTLATVSGRTATFVSGGAFPVHTPGQRVHHLEHGTRVSVAAHLLENGKIHLTVRPRLSSLDFTRPVNRHGFSLPRHRIAEAEVEAEINPGDTLAIGRLGQQPVKKNVAPPRPVAANSNPSTETLILVTPRLTDPPPHGEQHGNGRIILKKSKKRRS